MWVNVCQCTGYLCPQGVRRMHFTRCCVLLAISLSLSIQKAVSYTDVMQGCKLPTKYDDVIGYSSLYGPLNPNDVVWHNEEWAYRQYGPISKFILYKAWFYDGEWHDPGEWKGLQTWYGHGAEQHTHDDKLLFGARRPHVPQEFKLYRDEVLVRAELEWDTIMRWANFTSSLGRYFAWGFRNATPGVTKAVVQAPPGGYIAAFRGYEGKPLPKELGGYKKRYISQIGFVWAKRDCSTAKPTVTESGMPQQPAVQRKPTASDAAPTYATDKATGAAQPAKPPPAALAVIPTKPIAAGASPAAAAAATHKPAPEAAAADQTNPAAKPATAAIARQAAPARSASAAVAGTKPAAAVADSPVVMSQREKALPAVQPAAAACCAAGASADTKPAAAAKPNKTAAGVAADAVPIKAAAMTAGRSTGRSTQPANTTAAAAAAKPMAALSAGSAAAAKTAPAGKTPAKPPAAASLAGASPVKAPTTAGAAAPVSAQRQP